MTQAIAESLLKEMNQMGTDFMFYRGQRITRRYLHRILWKAQCYQDHKDTMKYSSRILPLEVSNG